MLRKKFNAAEIKNIFQQAKELIRKNTDIPSLEEKLRRHEEKILKNEMALQIINDMIEIEGKYLISEMAPDHPEQDVQLIPTKITPQDYHIFSFDIQNQKATLYIPRNIVIDDNATKKRDCLATAHGQFGSYMPLSQYFDSLTDDQLSYVFKSAKESLSNKKLINLDDAQLVEVLGSNARTLNLFLTQVPTFQANRIRKFVSLEPQASDKLKRPLPNGVNSDGEKVTDVQAIFQRVKKLIVDKSSLIEKKIDSALEMKMEQFEQSISSDQIAKQLMVDVIDIGGLAQFLNEMDDDVSFSDEESDEASSEVETFKELDLKEILTPQTVAGFDDEQLADLIGENQKIYRYFFTEAPIDQLKRAMKSMSISLQLNLIEEVLLGENQQQNSGLSLVGCAPDRCLVILTSLDQEVIKELIGTPEDLDKCLKYVSADASLEDDNSYEFLAHFEASLKHHQPDDKSNYIKNSMFTIEKMKDVEVSVDSNGMEIVATRGIVNS